MKIINKINPRISAFKFKDEVRAYSAKTEHSLRMSGALFR